MQKFHKILFVSHGTSEETEALKQALSLARNNAAELKALIVCPEFPKEMVGYKDKYRASLTEQLEISIQATRAAIKVSEAEVPVPIEIDSGSGPAVRIVSNVLKNAHDLVIKEAEPKETQKGFKALDMDLLRKCPCPVWLTRPISRSRNEIKVAVAIDPQSVAPEGHDLSVRLLQLARSLADTCNGELEIISCWNYQYEDYLRQNIWIKMPEDELQSTMLAAQNDHRSALENVIKESKIQGKYHIHHLHGQADSMISQHVTDHTIDILVMGTVARRGIPGLVIGNTAENILQKLECSLVALKPTGFVSPVKT